MAPAYADVFGVLSNQYHAAVMRLSEVDGERAKAEAEHLAEHLMLYYLRGQLETDTGKRILADFWKLASMEVRGSALEFLGRMLRSLGPVPDSAILDRLAALVDSRIDASHSAKAAELRYFGYWFASGKFADQWALDRLSRVLDLIKTVDDVREVMTRLVRLYDEYPQTVADIVGKIVAGIDRSWGVFSIRDALKEILGRMIASADNDLKTRARGLIDQLGEQGQLEFRALLPKKAS